MLVKLKEGGTYKEEWMKLGIDRILIIVYHGVVHDKKLF